MQNRLSERLLEATIISIRWERVIVHIDVQLKYKDGALPGMDLEFCSWGFVSAESVARRPGKAFFEYYEYRRLQVPAYGKLSVVCLQPAGYPGKMCR